MALIAFTTHLIACGNVNAIRHVPRLADMLIEFRHWWKRQFDYCNVYHYGSVLLYETENDVFFAALWLSAV